MERTVLVRIIPPVTGHFPGGDPILENSPLPSRAWLQADPDRLDRFADELDELVGELRRVRSRQSDLATFLGPIDELRTQAAAARAAARDVRELGLTAIAHLPKADR